MNILFIGPYAQGTDGWQNAAYQYVKALSKTQHNLTIRSISMNGRFVPTQPDLIKLEKNTFDNYDIVIQNALPHFFQYNGNFKNIGLAHFESYCLNHTSWPHKINMMDEMWVPSMSNVDMLSNSDVKTKTQVVPIPMDVSIFDKEYPQPEIPEINDSFLFLCVGEWTQRKGWEDLLIAFHTEFHRSEPVNLILKVNKMGVSADQMVNFVREANNKIKERIRVYNTGVYKNIIVISEWLKEESLYGLYQKADVYVQPSYGESFNIPSVLALGFGKTPIITSGVGCDIIDDNCGYLIKSYFENIGMQDKPIEDLYTSREYFRKPVIASLRNCMRQAYENRDLRQRKKEYGKKIISQLSYDNVAKHIEEILQ